MKENGMIQKVLSPITEHAHVETVFGKPQVLKEKIVIPVARVFLVFGGGMGSAMDENNQPGEGGGGGFVLSTQPIGVLEITEGSTHLVRFRSWWQRLLPVVFGFLIGTFVLKWVNKNKK